MTTATEFGARLNSASQQLEFTTMTTGNLIFWTCFFGAIAALLAFTNIASLFHPVPLVLAALAVSVVHEHT